MSGKADITTTEEGRLSVDNDATEEHGSPAAVLVMNKERNVSPNATKEQIMLIVEGKNDAPVPAPAEEAQEFESTEKEATSKNTAHGTTTDNRRRRSKRPRENDISDLSVSPRQKKKGTLVVEKQQQQTRTTTTAGTDLLVLAAQKSPQLPVPENKDNDSAHGKNTTTTSNSSGTSKFGSLVTAASAAAGILPEQQQQQQPVTTMERKRQHQEKQDQFMAGLIAMYPRKAVKTMRCLRQQSGGEPLRYDDAPTIKAFSHRAYADYANDLDRILFTISNGSATNAAHILKALCRRSTLAPVMDHMDPWDVQAKQARRHGNKKGGGDNCANVDRTIAQGVEDFVRNHTTGGRRPKHEQDAVDAVMTAACSANKKFEGGSSSKSTRKRCLPLQKKNPDGTSRTEDVNKAQEEEEGIDNGDGPAKTNRDSGTTKSNHEQDETTFPLDQIAARFGVHTKRLLIYRNDMASKRFVPKVVKTRKDCYRKEAAACVREFCHSDESSWPLKTESKQSKYAFRQFMHPDTGEQEQHPVRIWHERTDQQRYSIFAKSTAYRQFLARQQQQQQEQHPTGESDGGNEEASEQHGVSGVSGVGGNNANDAGGGKNNNNKKKVKTIGRSVFQMCVCPCVLNHHPRGVEREKNKPLPPIACQIPDDDSGNNRVGRMFL